MGKEACGYYPTSYDNGYGSDDGSGRDTQAKKGVDSMTNLDHIAGYLRREVARLYKKADYLDEKGLATDDYILCVEEMGAELEEVADCIERYYEVKKALSRMVLDVPSRAGRRPRIPCAEYIRVENGSGD